MFRGHVHIHVATHNVESTFSSVPTHPPEITLPVAVIFYVSILLLLYYHAIYIIFSHLVFMKNIATRKSRELNTKTHPPTHSGNMNMDVTLT